MASNALLLSVAIALTCLLRTLSALTTKEYNQNAQHIRQNVINGQTVVPTLVRLAFHDCVGTSCDGCINLSNPSNDGLADLIALLETHYSTLPAAMTRSDYWQLAAHLALENGIRKQQENCGTDTTCMMPDLSLTFSTGRVDCATSPTTTEMHTLPGPTMASADMFSFFSSTYGFSEAETIALMGAHSLGGANKNNSGYTGSWIVNEADTFDNGFHSNIVNTAIEYAQFANEVDTTLADRKFQFNLRTTSADGVITRLGMMLPSDMALAYEVSLDTNTGFGCGFGTAATTMCPELTANLELCKTFASDRTAMLNAFEPVYEKMRSHGYTSLTPVG